MKFRSLLLLIVVPLFAFGILVPSRPADAASYPFQVFVDSNYRGASRSFSGEVTDLSKYSASGRNLDNSVSSISFASTTAKPFYLSLYEDPNFKGYCITLSSGAPELAYLNDRVSSIRAGDCSGKIPTTTGGGATPCPTPGIASRVFTLPGGSTSGCPSVPTPSPSPKPVPVPPPTPIPTPKPLDGPVVRTIPITNPAVDASSQIDIAWTGVEGATNYKVVYYVGSSTAATVRDAKTTLSGSLTGLPQDTEVRIEVRTLITSGKAGPTSNVLVAHTAKKNLRAPSVALSVGCPASKPVCDPNNPIIGQTYKLIATVSDANGLSDIQEVRFSVTKKNADGTFPATWTPLPPAQNGNGAASYSMEWTVPSTYKAGTEYWVGAGATDKGGLKAEMTSESRVNLYLKSADAAYTEASGFSIGAASATALRISWNKKGSAEGFNIYLTGEGAAKVHKIKSVVDDDSVVLGSLKPGVNYCATIFSVVKNVETSLHNDPPICASLAGSTDLKLRAENTVVNGSPGIRLRWNKAAIPAPTYGINAPDLFVDVIEPAATATVMDGLRSDSNDPSEGTQEISKKLRKWSDASVYSLKPGTQYCFRGYLPFDSSKSQQVCITTRSTTLPPIPFSPNNPPTGFKADRLGPNNIYLTWNPVSGVDSYLIEGTERKQPGDAKKPLDYNYAPSSTDSQIMATQLDPGAEYCYTIKAVKGLLSTKASVEACATTDNDFSLIADPAVPQKDVVTKLSIDHSRKALLDEVESVNYYLQPHGKEYSEIASSAAKTNFAISKDLSSKLVAGAVYRFLVVINLKQREGLQPSPALLVGTEFTYGGSSAPAISFIDPATDGVVTPFAGNNQSLRLDLDFKAVTEGSIPTSLTITTAANESVGSYDLRTLVPGTDPAIKKRESLIGLSSLLEGQKKLLATSSACLSASDTTCTYYAKVSAKDSAGTVVSATRSFKVKWGSFAAAPSMSFIDPAKDGGVITYTGGAQTLPLVIQLINLDSVGQKAEVLSSGGKSLGYIGLDDVQKAGSTITEKTGIVLSQLLNTQKTVDPGSSCLLSATGTCQYTVKTKVESAAVTASRTFSVIWGKQGPGTAGNITITSPASDAVFITSAWDDPSIELAATVTNIFSKPAATGTVLFNEVPIASDIQLTFDPVDLSSATEETGEISPENPDALTVDSVTEAHKKSSANKACLIPEKSCVYTLELTGKGGDGKPVIARKNFTIKQPKKEEDDEEASSSLIVLTGKVTDAETGKPISYAKAAVGVGVEGDAFSAGVNSEGVFKTTFPMDDESYDDKGVLAGFSIQVRADGYMTAAKAITLKKGVVHYEVDFKLSPGAAKCGTWSINDTDVLGEKYQQPAYLLRYEITRKQTGKVNTLTTMAYPTPTSICEKDNIVPGDTIRIIPNTLLLRTSFSDKGGQSSTNNTIGVPAEGYTFVVPATGNKVVTLVRNRNFPGIANGAVAHIKGELVDSKGFPVASAEGRVLTVTDLTTKKSYDVGYDGSQTTFQANFLARPGGEYEIRANSAAGTKVLKTLELQPGLNDLGKLVMDDVAMSSTIVKLEAYVFSTQANGAKDDMVKKVAITNVATGKKVYQKDIKDESVKVTLDRSKIYKFSLQAGGFAPVEIKNIWEVAIKDDEGGYTLIVNITEDGCPSKKVIEGTTFCFYGEESVFMSYDPDYDAVWQDVAAEGQKLRSTTGYDLLARNVRILDDDEVNAFVMGLDIANNFPLNLNTGILKQRQLRPVMGDIVRHEVGHQFDFLINIKNYPDNGGVENQKLRTGYAKFVSLYNRSVTEAPYLFNKEVDELYNGVFGGHPWENKEEDFASVAFADIRYQNHFCTNFIQEVNSLQDREGDDLVGKKIGLEKYAVIRDMVKGTPNCAGLDSSSRVTVQNMAASGEQIPLGSRTQIVASVQKVASTGLLDTISNAIKSVDPSVVTFYYTPEKGGSPVKIGKALPSADKPGLVSVDWDLSSLPKGTYYLTAQDANGHQAMLALPVEVGDFLKSPKPCADQCSVPLDDPILDSSVGEL